MRGARRARRAASGLAASLVLLPALGEVACGRYGPPVREKPAKPTTEAPAELLEEDLTAEDEDTEAAR